MSWAENFNDGWLSVAQCCNVAPETVRDDMRWPRWAKRSPLWEPWISSPPLWTNQRREDLWRWSAIDDRQTIRIQYIYIYTTIHPYYHIWFIVYIVCILDDYYHNMDGSYIWMVGSHTWMVWLAQNNLLDPFGDFTYLHIVTCVLVKMHDDMMSVPETVDHDARHDFHIFRGDGPIIQIYPDHVTPLRTDMEPRTLKLKHRFEKYVWDDVGC